MIELQKIAYQLRVAIEKAKKNGEEDDFYEFDGTDLPISAWIMRLIVLMLDNLIKTVLGFKVVYLHSLPEDINFYKRNGFEKVKVNMQPLYSVDDDYTPMFMPLRPFIMNYDE